MRTMPTPPWALLLAGGEGRRLRPLTRQISGDARPKQFCPIFDGETLLDRTRRRADLLSRMHNQVVVVSRHHAPYYAPLAREFAPGRLVVQPDNAGTAPGVLYPLLRIRHLAGNVPVTVYPSDHYVSDEGAFVGAVSHAVEVVRLRPDLVVLMGIEATSPETEYGWIETDEFPLPLVGEPAFPIRRFWEKPSARLAERLFERGALWNSFVMVGWVDAFLALAARAAPELLRALEPLRRVIGTGDEPRVAEEVYRELASEPIGFSERILAPATDGLVTVRVKGVDWSDWGHPERVVATMRRTGWRPAWLGRVGLASAG
ncbi:MAG TPA: sugar phosphate nucleotidyltransferase [Methylomirabilota bacterium]|jgi:mannose-1-phosphate guanylyltransferase|nr:sugar phosphate nucleotidyltransferase [Methylomirabilota bacterium]